MGGGGGSTPTPKTFTPPPINDGPATNPIANFFGARGTGGPAPTNPFAALAQIPTTQAYNPFSGGTTAPLTAPIVQQPQQGSFMAQPAPQQTAPQPAPAAALSPQDLIRNTYRTMGDMLNGKASKSDYDTALREALSNLLKGGQ